MNIEIHDGAVRDLLEGYRFYEGQSAGLGSYFLDSLCSDIDSLLLYAGIHEMAFGFHRLLAKRFPFAVYYEVSGDKTRVYAVLDCRRDPDKIRERLGNVGRQGEIR